LIKRWFEIDRRNIAQTARIIRAQNHIFITISNKKGADSYFEPAPLCDQMNGQYLTYDTN